MNSRAMITGERATLSGDPIKQAQALAARLEEADKKRSGYLDLAAEGLMTKEELRGKLVGLRRHARQRRGS